MTDSGSDHGLPRPRHGFDSAPHGQSVRGDERTSPGQDLLGPSDAYDDADVSDLPDELEDIANPLATVAPHVSQFVLYVDPTRREHMRFFETFALAEEMMHGRRHQFGLTRSHHLAVYKMLRAFFAYLDGDLGAEVAARDIWGYDLRSRSIHAKRASILETVDRYLCQSVMDEPGYLDRHVDAYLESDPEIDRETVEDRFAAVQEVFREAARNEDRTLYERLTGIEETYSRRIAETVADTALDIPYLIEPLQVDGYESIPVEDLDLHERFAAAAEALEEITVDDPDEADSETIRRDLESRIETRAGDAPRHPRELSMPLLDVPQALGADDAGQNRYDAVMDAPTAIGRVVNAAFRFKGNFGGAVYRIPSDDGSPVQNWFVNPLVADEPVGPTAGLPPLRGSETYRDLWEWTFVGAYLVKQLLGQLGWDERARLVCPLCRVSMGGHCGEKACAFRQTVDLANDRRDQFLDAMEATDHSPLNQ